MKTIKSKFLLFSVIQIVVVVSATLAISYIYFYKALEQNYKASSAQTINQIAGSIDSYINDINKMSIAFHYTEAIKDFFNNNTSYFKDEEMVLENAQLYVDALVDMKTEIDGIYLLRNDGISTYRSSASIHHSPYAVNVNATELFDELKGNEYLVKIRRRLNSNQSVITFSRRFLNVQFKDKYCGVIVIDTNINMLQNIMGKINPKSSGQVFIEDKDGYLVYHPDKSLIGEKFEDVHLNNNIDRSSVSGNFLVNDKLGKRLVNYRTSNSTGWTIISVMEWDTLVRNATAMRDNIITVGILLSIISFITVSLFSYRLTKPLAQLKDSMERVKDGNFDDIKVTIGTNDEIGQLGRDFSDMLQNIRRLISQVVSEQNQKRVAEFKALQSQINPHFLYNTLESVIWMISSDKKNESIEMLNSFTNLMRISLSGGKEIISIKKELEHLSCYLMIQKVRYGSKMNVKFDINEDVYEYTIPKLTLQPIVENAIYHGIKNKKCSGHIKVIAKKMRDTIAFKIIDDGIGMKMEMMQKITNGLLPDSKGYGIANVNERIKLTYGQEYGMRFLSKYGKGTMVVINIPICKEGDAKSV